MEKTKIIVIGSSNTDMVVKSDRIPSSGETVLGGEFMMTAGGKGANQAVAVVKMNGDLTFVAKVGKDIFGEKAIQNYAKSGINTDYIFRDDDTPSGIALIMVDKCAENCISVASGANNMLSRRDIDSVRNIIEHAAILLMQLEIPIDVIEYAVDIAYRAGVKIVLNPAPANYVDSNTLKKLYLITPNKTEAQIISGIQITNIDSAKKAAEVLADKGVNNVIITLGTEGSLILTDNREFHYVKSRKVDAIDTTAAGDVYNGALCVALSEGKTLVEAAKFATLASSISVTRMGAQDSIPTRSEVDILI
ncbi:MAG: ribokinase [Prevotella sp.]|jgi:ribokinase|nr:ribokinase [Prevotella sp.]